MGDSSIVWGCTTPAADWLGGEASDSGGVSEPTGLLGEPGEPLISAVLVVAVMGRWGIRMATTGTVCSCGRSLGGEIFPCTNTECSNRTEHKAEDEKP